MSDYRGVDIATCPQCKVTIIHHKDHQIKFCGMCDYEFEEVENE